MQAVIITAYKDPEMLYRLCGELDREHFSIFIHIDKRYIRDFDAGRLKAGGNVEVYSEYATTWGSIKHLYAILLLLKKAVSHNEVSYIHIISGQDYPVHDIREAENDNRIYLSDAPVPEERYRQYNICGMFDQGKRAAEDLYRRSVRLQKLIGIRRCRLGEYESIYKGTVWSSMPKAAAEYALDKAGEQGFLKDLRTTYIPEEFFFQTIFFNSPEWRERVVRNNRRYVVWDKRDGLKAPAVLDERDIEAIRGTDAWFARKMDSVLSAGLLDMLDRENYF
ncbi:MAG: beta-1,6-N-acetylglucosaminyltransferase [Lachnospiraceae bacterium]|nr:beta-1,6-N-acetylglucosaminyltransferase [Lachnospiraceae bacterium]